MTPDAQYLAISAQGAHRLFHYSYAHSKFVSAPVICFLDCNRLGFVNRSQSLLMDLGRNHEIAAHIVFKRRVVCSANGVQTAGYSNHRSKAALCFSNEVFIAPMRAAAAS